MKVKNILAATGLLVLAAATGAWAQTTYPTCKSGTIAPSSDIGMGAVGAGYMAPGGVNWFGNRYVSLTCDSGQMINSTATNNTDSWNGTTARTFVISSASVWDPDGKYATVLTALALGKKVAFTAQNFGIALDPNTNKDDATCKTWNPTTGATRACTAGNRIIMSIGILP